MTNFAAKYNKQHSGYDYKFPEVPVYIKPAELFKENGADTVYPVWGLFINDKGQYGPQPIVCTDGNMIVNLPSHMLPTVEEMREDAELTEAINQGRFGFKIYRYQRKGENRNLYSVEWVNIDIPF